MRPMARSLLGTGLTVGVAACVLAACVTQGGTEQTTKTTAPGPSAQAAATATAETAAHDIGLDPAISPADLPKEECGQYTTETDRVPPAIGPLAENSAALVDATIADVGEGQWNTPEGHPPVRPDIDASRAMRLVRIAVKSTLRGSLTSDIVAIPGGSVGCATFNTDLIPSKLAVGDEGLFFVSHEAPRTGARDVLMVSEIWPVVDGKITLPGGDQVTIAEAKSELAK